MMLRRPSQLRARPPIERDSEETFGFSARNSCVQKRLRESISDGCGGHL